MRPPPLLFFEGNIKQNWECWHEAFEIYLLASNLDGKFDARKIATLLNLAGQEAKDKYKTFSLSAQQKEKYDNVVKAFKDFCTPKTNLTVERQHSVTEKAVA